MPRPSLAYAANSPIAIGGKFHFLEEAMAWNLTDPARLSALEAAREAKLKPWSLKESLVRYHEIEAERLEFLTADVKTNPKLYCKRVAPMPADNTCTKCFKVGTLIPERLEHFLVFTCQLCGTEYFPDVEPIPRSEVGSTAGRHHDALPGEHHITYDADYRKNKKGKKDVTA